MTRPITKPQKLIATQLIERWDSLADDEHKDRLMGEFTATLAAAQTLSQASIPVYFSAARMYIKDASGHADAARIHEACQTTVADNAVRVDREAKDKAKALLGMLDFNCEPLITYSVAVVRAHGGITRTKPADWAELLLALMVVGMRRCECMLANNFTADPEKEGYVTISKLSKNQNADKPLLANNFTADPEKEGYVTISKLSKNQNADKPFSFPVIEVSVAEFLEATTHFKTAYEGASVQEVMEKFVKTSPRYTEIRTAYRDKFGIDYTPHHSRGLGAAWVFHLTDDGTGDSRMKFAYVCKDLLCHLDLGTSLAYSDNRHVPTPAPVVGQKRVREERSDADTAVLNAGRQVRAVKTRAKGHEADMLAAQALMEKYAEEMAAVKAQIEDCEAGIANCAQEMVTANAELETAVDSLV